MTWTRADHSDLTWLLQQISGADVNVSSAAKVISTRLLLAEDWSR